MRNYIYAISQISSITNNYIILNDLTNPSDQQLLYTLMHSEQTNKVEVILIRHGQSQYNSQADLLRQKLGIGPTWEEYLKNPQFMQFKYCQEMMDCSLSQKGIEQCDKISDSIDYSGIDLILVSPLYRALKSCNIIFKNRNEHQKIDIVVDPIFAESLRCTCDVSCNLFKAKQEFSDFNYSFIEGRQGSWYIDNQPTQKQQLYNTIINQDKAETYQQRAKAINSYLAKTHNFQDAFDLISRFKQARKKLKQYATDRKSHYYSIIYLTGYQFDQKGKSLSHKFIRNATPMKYYMDIGLDSSDKQFLVAENC